MLGPLCSSLLSTASAAEELAARDAEQVKGRKGKTRRGGAKAKRRREHAAHAAEAEAAEAFGAGDGPRHKRAHPLAGAGAAEEEPRAGGLS